MPVTITSERDCEQAVNWDLERMKKAVNAPYVTVPDNIKTSKDFNEWINNLTDEDFI